MNYDFKQAFITACNTPSDINQHLPLMNVLAKLCNHVTEFGVRWGTSTLAWLNNNVILHSYDIERFPESQELFEHARKAGKSAYFWQHDTLTLGAIAPTDLLFIDSLHTYHQVKSELHYESFVEKFIVLHDTVLFGEQGQDGSTPGIMQAVHEFLQSHPEWTVMEHRTNNNGLLVLVRRNYL
jgi:cephalosporin hydroxylase